MPPASRFRQTLLCRAELPLRFGFSPDMAARLHVACMARPVSSKPDLASDAPEKFPGDKDANMEVSLPLAKASLVVLANRYGVRDLLSLDERHFRALRGPGGRPFRMLPADAG